MYLMEIVFQYALLDTITIKLIFVFDVIFPVECVHLLNVYYVNLLPTCTRNSVCLAVLLVCHINSLDIAQIASA